MDNLPLEMIERIGNYLGKVNFTTMYECFQKKEGRKKFLGVVAEKNSKLMHEISITRKQSYIFQKIINFYKETRASFIINN